MPTDAAAGGETDDADEEAGEVAGSRPGPGGGDGAGYVVEVKSSARRRNEAAARWVAERGSRRTFPSKGAAREWAREASEGDALVWVQDAAPGDESGVDGYVVGGERRARRAREETGDLASFDG